MNIVLIGYRGSGKTTIGGGLARRLGLPFVDSDDLVILKAGKNIRQIFEQHGEAYFRDIETQAIRELSEMDHCVIALGGGAVIREENRRLLKEGGHKIVYLRCDPAVLAKRIQGDPQSVQSRPNLTRFGGGLEEITHLLAQREPVYREAMSVELDVTHLTAEQAVEALITLI